MKKLMKIVYFFIIIVGASFILASCGTNNEDDKLYAKDQIEKPKPVTIGIDKGDVKPPRPGGNGG